MSEHDVLRCLIVAVEGHDGIRQVGFMQTGINHRRYITDVTNLRHRMRWRAVRPSSSLTAYLFSGWQGCAPRLHVGARRFSAVLQAQASLASSKAIRRAIERFAPTYVAQTKSCARKRGKSWSIEVVSNKDDLAQTEHDRPILDLDAWRDDIFSSGRTVRSERP